MGIKHYLNTRNGRTTLFVSILAIIALSIAGAILWFLIYLPQITSETALGKLVSNAGTISFKQIVLEEEENGLKDLPSSTLTIVSDAGEFRKALDYPTEMLNDRKLDTILNVKISEQTDDEKANALNFYSSSLKDYEAGNAYDETVALYDNVKTDRISSLVLTTKPLFSKGRVLDLNLTVDGDFTTSDIFLQTWSSLVQAFVDEDFSDGTSVNLTLSDKTGVTFSTLIASEEDVNRALNLDPFVLSNIKIYLRGSSYSSLGVSKVVYNIERTPQDSFMTVMVDPATKDINIPELFKRTAKISDNPLAYPWSYITYFVASGETLPFYTLYSSSRNW